MVDARAVLVIAQPHTNAIAASLISRLMAESPVKFAPAVSAIE